MDTICFFGDSLVNGVDDPERLGWPGRLLQAAGKRGFAPTAYNLGVRADTSARVLARFEAETRARVFPGAGMRLVFSFGVADAKMESGSVRLTVEQSVDNLRQILTCCGSLPLDGVYVVGPLPVLNDAHRARLEDMDRAFADTCTGLRVPYLGVLAAMAADAAYMDSLAAGDGAHPHAAGYAAVAKMVDEWDAWREVVTAS